VQWCRGAAFLDIAQSVRICRGVLFGKAMHGNVEQEIE
jgi:hypothetical protein